MTYKTLPWYSALLKSRDAMLMLKRHVSQETERLLDKTERVGTNKTDLRTE